MHRHGGRALIGVVPQSAELAAAAACGEPLPENTLAFAALDNIARRILGEEVPLAGALGGSDLRLTRPRVAILII